MLNKALINDSDFEPILKDIGISSLEEYKVALPCARFMYGFAINWGISFKLEKEQFLQFVQKPCEENI